MNDEQVIKRFDRKRLARLWTRLREGEDGGFPAGKAFEFLILRAFQLEGLHVIWPFSVGSEFGSGKTSHQIDGVIFLDHLCFLVEAKHWDRNVDYGPVALLQAHLSRRPPGTMGLIFASEGITDMARELTLLAGQTQVLFWSGSEIDWAMAKRGRFKRGLHEKFRHAASHAMPDFDPGAQ